MKSRILLFCMMLTLLSFSGCVSTQNGNIGNVQSYTFAEVEPDWVRNGEPIEFDNDLWFPEDGVETLLDSEMLPVGTYKDVKFFIEKVDVWPYERLYTKFSRNQFRYFERRE